MKSNTKKLLLLLGALTLVGGFSLSTPVKAETNPSIKKLIGSDRYSTAVELSKKQFNNAKIICLVNGDALSDGLTITPLASYYKSPILLSYKDSLPQSTKDEILRLKARKVFIGGSDGVISQSVVNELKSLGIKEVVRLGGKDRYDTALEIAKYIDANCFQVKEIAVAYGYGEPDSLSVASVAGSNQMAIFLTEKEKLNSNSYEWLKSKNLSDAYIIGSEGVVSDDVLKNIDSMTASDVTKNRLGGNDRYETNAKVIERFFPNELAEAYVSKGWDEYLIDALSSGVISALNNSPVILLKDKDQVNMLQEAVLYPKKVNTLYEVGGGLNQISVQRVNELLSGNTLPSSTNWLILRDRMLDRGWQSYEVYTGDELAWYENGSKLAGYISGGTGRSIGLTIYSYSDAFGAEIQTIIDNVCPEASDIIWEYIEEHPFKDVIKHVHGYEVSFRTYSNGQIDIDIYK